jgi:phage baseplate assembly protein W
MAITQKYGIKYPFTSDDNEGTYLDLNKTYADGVQSQVLHVLFTPKGQKLRDPDFGTNLVRYIFNPLDGETFNDIKTEMTRQISKYVPSVEFRDVTIYNNEASENGIIVMVEYGVKNGNKLEIKTVAVKL